MQHPKDVKGSDKSLLSIPVGQRYTTILDRLDRIEENVIVFNQRLWNIESRLDKLEEKNDAID